MEENGKGRRGWLFRYVSQAHTVISTFGWISTCYFHFPRLQEARHCYNASQKDKIVRNIEATTIVFAFLIKSGRAAK